MSVLAAALAGSSGAGLLAAALYALYPPAITYGSLAYLDPLLAFFVCAALTLAVTRPVSWFAVGMLVGAAISTKQSGLVALALVPLAGMACSTLTLRGAFTFALACTLVFLCFNNPQTYLAGLLDPIDPYGQLRPSPLDSFKRNMSFLASPDSYYWLSYTKHGRPYAAELAPYHYLLTPAYLAAFALSTLHALSTRAGRVLATAYAPILVTLALLPPSDGAWRVQMLSPLLCCAIAYSSFELRKGGRIVLAMAAVAATAWALVPAPLSESGQLSLGDLLRRSEVTDQPIAVYRRYRGEPVRVHLAPSESVRYRFRAKPGKYRFTVEATGWNAVEIDGSGVFVGASGSETTTLSGHFHEIEIKPTKTAVLSELMLSPIEQPATQSENGAP